MSTITTSDLLKEVDDLVVTGERIVRGVSVAESELSGSELAPLMAWVSRVGQIIRKLAGPSSAYETIYQTALKEESFTFIHANHCGHISQIYGAVRGLQEDLKAGLLADLRLLLQADIFADFLEMADHLLKEGYKDAAAVLIGGVLEDALRKLAQKAGLSLTGSSGRPLTIDLLNVALAKAAVYQPLTQKQITSWADVRNSAAHGHYTNYSADDVKQMLYFVQKFCADYLQ
jgi:hypothetical protein